MRRAIEIEFSVKKFAVFVKNDFLGDFFEIIYSKNPKIVTIFKTRVPNPKYGMRNVNWFCIEISTVSYYFESAASTSFFKSSYPEGTPRNFPST